MKEALSLKGAQRIRKQEKLKEKIAKLENSLEEKDKKIEKLEGKFKPPKKKEKLPKYPYCGFEGVYKNDSYRRKPNKFFDRLKKIEEKEERV